MLSTIELFNKKIEVKGYCCCCNKEDTMHIEYPAMNLYIAINDICNSKCDFCNVHKYPSKNCKLDLNKLKIILTELKNKDALNRIAIAGGEPTLSIDTLNDVLNLIKEVCPGYSVTLNTNGTNLNAFHSLDNLNVLEGIHISRHHYDDNKNNKIFHKKTATLKDIEDFISKIDNKRLIRLNCNLIKGYIDNYEKVKEYLEMAAKLKIFRTGFVSLMKINNFCNENFIDYNDIVSEFDNNMAIPERTYDKNICECFNSLYISQLGKPVECYFRKVKDLNCKYIRQLQYTCDNKLTGGFGKEIIY